MTETAVVSNNAITWYPLYREGWPRILLLSLLVPLWIVLAVLGTATLHYVDMGESAAVFWIVNWVLLWIPSFLFCGYLQRVGRQASGPEPLALPPISNLLDMLFSGVKTLVAGILSGVTALVPLATISGLVVYLAYSVVGSQKAFLLIPIAMLGFAFLNLAFYIYAYVIFPLCFVRYAKSQKFSDFFSFRWAFRLFQANPWDYLTKNFVWIALMHTPLVIVAWPLVYMNGVHSVGRFYSDSCASI